MDLNKGDGMTATPIVEAIRHSWSEILNFDCPPAGLTRRDLVFRIEETRLKFTLKFQKRLFGILRKIALGDPVLTREIKELYFRPAKTQPWITVRIARKNQQHLWSVFCYLIAHVPRFLETFELEAAAARSEAEKQTETAKRQLVTCNKDLIRAGIREIITSLGIKDQVESINSHYGLPEKQEAATKNGKKKYFAKVYWKGLRGAARKTQGCGPDPEAAIADLRLKLESRQA